MAYDWLIFHWRLAEQKMATPVQRRSSDGAALPSAMLRSLSNGFERLIGPFGTKQTQRKDAKQRRWTWPINGVRGALSRPFPNIGQPLL